MPNLRIHLDTSVFGGLLDTQMAHRVAATQALLAHLMDFEPHVSPLVIEETEAHGDPDPRERLLAAARPLPIVPSDGPAVAALVDEYLRWGAVPASARNDAVHVAAATAARLDVVVSWNLRHLVKIRTRRLVNAVNAALGHAAVEIVTPEEL